MGALPRFAFYILGLVSFAVFWRGGLFQSDLRLLLDSPCALPSKAANSTASQPHGDDTSATTVPTVPLETTPESCRRSALFPGQLPNYFVCPEHHQPQCPIERHLYIVHGKSGSSTTTQLVKKNCPKYGERMHPKNVQESLRNVPKSFKPKENTVLVQAEGVIPYRFYAEKFQTIGNCYASMFMMRDPWTRYQSDFAYRSHMERGRKDLYVHQNDSNESFMDRYPNYVTATLGDPQLHERCTRYAKSEDYSWPCYFQEARYRGPEILAHVLDNLRRDYTVVGLMEDLPTSMVLFQHAVGSDNKFCNQTGFLEMATFRRANAHKHKELDRSSEAYQQYQKYFWLDEILYEAVKVLYQEQLQKAQQIPALKAQLDQLTSKE